MLMQNFLKTRQSVRDFHKRKGLTVQQVQGVKKVVEEVNDRCASHEAKLLFVEDGKKVVNALDGLGGYSGVMIKAPAYLVLLNQDGSEEASLYGAYALEMAITRLDDLGLGSCWVTVKDVDESIKKSFYGGESGTCDYMLAFGPPAAKAPGMEKGFSSRIGISEFVFINDFHKPATIETLESRGMDDLFFYLRYAPSAYNAQPWRFVIEEDRVTLFIEDFKGARSLADAGIMMYYYEVLVASLGVSTDWTVDLEECGKYRQIAYAAL